jgi:Protein of unknown function (DUF3037)
MNAFEYAVLRAVPRIERGESVNIGVIIYCQALDYLGTATSIDPARLRVLDPEVDVDGVRAAVDAVRAACDGEGPAGAGSRGERFRWLTSPRSTVVQPGPVHAGLTQDPAAELARLLERLVR